MSLGALASGALSASPLGGLLGLNKATLNVYKPNVPTTASAKVTPSGKAEKSYEFDYNPETLTFTSKMEPRRTGTDAQATSQPGPPEPSKMDFELFYSLFEVGDLLAPKLKINDLTKLKNELLALTSPHPSTKPPKTPHPPLVDFSWGNLITDPGLVTNVTVTYTHMLPNGTPVRMSAKITVEATLKDKPGTNPTSGGRSNRKTHTLLAGETLATVAYAEFNDAGLWRAIAEENEIDDPMRMRAGAVLLLPTFEE